MIIEETVQLKQRLIETLTEEYSEERSGIHVSDLASCIRKAVFEKLQPAPLSETDLMLFVLGEGHHQIIQLLAGRGVATAEKEVELDGIIGTLDLLDNGVPIEIKTRRTKNREAEDTHVRQLTYYMAMVQSNVGILVYVMLNNLEDDEPKFICRTITLTDDELTGLKDELLYRRDLLAGAVEAKDAFRIHGEENDKECSACRYSEVCKPQIQSKISMQAS